MKHPLFAAVALIGVLMLSACNDPNRQYTHDNSPQAQQNNQELKNIPNDPDNFSALPTTQPLSNPQTPAGHQ